MALTRWTFVGKVMSLLFNMLSKFSVLFSMWSRATVLLGHKELDMTERLSTRTHTLSYHD